MDISIIIPVLNEATKIEADIVAAAANGKNVVLDFYKPVSCDFIYLDEMSFSKYITIFEDIFEYIMENNKLSNTDLIEFFHKISYLSKLSFEGLEDFWNRWKTNMRF